MPRIVAFMACGMAIALTVACSIEPSGERPGLGLPGEVHQQAVEDWSFSEDADEIFIETVITRTRRAGSLMSSAIRMSASRSKTKSTSKSSYQLQTPRRSPPSTADLSENTNTKKKPMRI